MVSLVPISGNALYGRHTHTVCVLRLKMFGCLDCSIWGGLLWGYSRHLQLGYDPRAMVEFCIRPFHLIVILISWRVNGRLVGGDPRWYSRHVEKFCAASSRTIAYRLHNASIISTDSYEWLTRSWWSLAGLRGRSVFLINGWRDDWWDLALAMR